ncbi:hypothetical protein pb186bvf_014833 [Paramecium bursaria]
MQHQLPESQYGSVRMRPSQLQIEEQDQQVSTRRRNFLSPTFSHNLPLFRELQAQPIRQEESIPQITQPDEKIISCHSQIVKSLLFNIFLQIFCINYTGYMCWQYSHRYVLLQLWVQDLVTIFILIYYNYRKGEDCIWQLIETMFLFFFKIFIVFYYEVQTFKIYFISIMMLSVSLILLLMKVFHKLKAPNKNSSELIIQFLKSMCCLQILLITLKWEQQLSWSWIQVFLLIWVLLVVCSLLTFIAFISCIETIVNVCKSKLQYHTLAGNLWLFLMLMGFTVFPFLFLIESSNFYEGNQFLHLESAAKYMCVTTFFTLIIVIYTACFYVQIKKHLREAQGLNEQEEQTSQQQQTQPQQPQQAKKLEFQKLNMPLYLIKLSCTYFAVLDKASMDFKRRQPSKDIESGRSAQSSTIKETLRNILNGQHHSNSLVMEAPRKADQDVEIPKPAITDKPQEDRSINDSSFNLEKCLVCYEQNPDIVFIPCRHGGICQACAEDILIKSKECYLCRKPIQQLLKVSRGSNKQLQVKEASIIV